MDQGEDHKILRIDFKGKEHSITELEVTVGHGDEHHENNENKENDIPFEVHVSELDEGDQWFLSGLWNPVTVSGNFKILGRSDVQWSLYSVTPISRERYKSNTTKTTKNSSSQQVKLEGHIPRRVFHSQM